MDMESMVHILTPSSEKHSKVKRLYRRCSSETKDPNLKLTWMPADLHLATASGTAALGGSIMEIKPTKRNPSKGKLGFSSASNRKPFGNWSAGNSKSQKPKTRSPKPPKSNPVWLVMGFKKR
uniref:Uncharacterized protein n=1 Tax=Romanomermis culicivorax TaxID=13658 RepID=A0A915KCL4_ROMCU